MHDRQFLWINWAKSERVFKDQSGLFVARSEEFYPRSRFDDDVDGIKMLEEEDHLISSCEQSIYMSADCRAIFACLERLRRISHARWVRIERIFV